MRMLPLELLESILSNLNNNKDLKACSLVCRDWTLYSQSQLFAYRNLQVPLFTKDQRQFGDVPDRLLSDMHRFRLYMDTEPGEPNQLCNHLRALNGRLINVDHLLLVIIGIEMFSVQRDEFILLVDTFRSITSLTLNSAVFATSAHFFTTLSALPSLRHLITRDAWVRSDRDMNASVTYEVNLSSLHVHAIDALLHWSLIAPSAAATLQRLQVQMTLEFPGVPGIVLQVFTNVSDLFLMEVDKLPGV
jgi:hypothetical protein